MDLALIRGFAVAMALVVMAHASRAHADDESSMVLFSPGVVVGSASSSAVVGGEASVVWTPSLPHSRGIPAPIVWGGAYVDGVYDSGASRGRFSIGPEAGIGPIGVDGGLVVQTAAGAVGATVRVLIGVGFVMGYTRWLYVDDARSSSPAHEYGLLFKLPIFELWPGKSKAVAPPPSAPPPSAPTPTPAEDTVVAP